MRFSRALAQDASGFPSTTVAAIKGLMLALGIAALIATLRWKLNARAR